MGAPFFLKLILKGINFRYLSSRQSINLLGVVRAKKIVSPISLNSLNSLKLHIPRHARTKKVSSTQT
jgi:hypothetical protein